MEHVNAIYDRSRNDPYSSSYNPGWRNHPNFSWNHNNASGGPSNFSRPPNRPHYPPMHSQSHQPPQGQNTNQPGFPNSNNLETRFNSLENLTRGLENSVKNFMSSTSQVLTSNQQTIKSLELQMGQLAQSVHEREGACLANLWLTPVLNST